MMEKQKGKISLLAIGMVIGFIFVIGVAMYFLFQENGALVYQNQNNNQQQQDTTASWNVMTNSGLGFTLKYPNNFFETGHEPKIFTGNCNYTVLPSTCANALTGWFLPGTGSNEIHWQNPNGQPTTINGTNYLLCQQGDAGAGHQYYYDYYVTVKNQTCQVVELDTSTSTCENYLPLEQGNTEQEKNYNTCIAQRENRPKVLQQIATTFTFTSK